MRLPLLLFLAGLAACTGAPSSKSGTDPQGVRSQIDSLDAQFNRWVNAGQVDSIMSHYYAPDAVLLVAGSPPLRGSDAIRAVYEGFYAMGIVRGRIQLSSIITADSVAADMGNYTLEIRGKTDTTKVLMSDHGNYMTVFARRNGDWRAIYDSNVSEFPAPTTPTTPAKSNMQG
jgi:ketosteroid isomerase-like protein